MVPIDANVEPMCNAIYPQQKASGRKLTLRASSMACLHKLVCSPSSNHNITVPCPTIVFSHASPSNLRQIPEPPTQPRAMAIGKRQLSLSSFAAIILGRFLADSPMALSAEELERYTDSVEGFTLLRPASWSKVDKAGATVLFEEADKGSNNVGIVVSPVRLSDLREFGTPEFVADKLIQAERRKESTKEVEVIGVAERSGQNGVSVYEFEYKLDSTRGGMKRVFSAAFVASKKLYLLNILHSDKPESPLDDSTRTMLEQVLHSFDCSPAT